MSAYIHPKKLNPTEVEDVMAKYFDMYCDVCGFELSTLTLQEAQYHYKHEHNMPDGYVKCCGLRLKSHETINKHILYHLKPDFLK